MSEPPCITKFNKIVIADLLNFLVKSCPSDSNVMRLKERITLAKNEDRTLLITEAGPFLHLYSDKIKKRDESFFRDFSNIPELVELNNAEDADPEINRMVNSLFNTINDVYFNKCDQNKKNELYGKILELLNLFYEYDRTITALGKKSLIREARGVSTGNVVSTGDVVLSNNVPTNTVQSIDKLNEQINELQLTDIDNIAGSTNIIATRQPRTKRG